MGILHDDDQEQQAQEWLRRAVPAHTCAFEENGAGVLIVGRGPLAIRDDVILVSYDQLAALAGGFLMNIVAPSMAAARVHHTRGNLEDLENGKAPPTPP